MITTIITVTTVTTVTTVSTIAAMGLTAAISIAAIITLIGFLVTKELVAASYSNSQRRIARFLGVGILPLIIVFAVVVAVKVTEVLA